MFFFTTKNASCFSVFFITRNLQKGKQIANNSGANSIKFALLLDGRLSYINSGCIEITSITFLQPLFDLLTTYFIAAVYYQSAKKQIFYLEQKIEKLMATVKEAVILEKKVKAQQDCPFYTKTMLLANGSVDIFILKRTIHNTVSQFSVFNYVQLNYVPLL